MFGALLLVDAFSRAIRIAHSTQQGQLAANAKQLNAKLDNIPVRLFNSRALNLDSRLKRLRKEDSPEYGALPLYMEEVESENEVKKANPANKRMFPNTKANVDNLNAGALKLLADFYGKPTFKSGRTRTMAECRAQVKAWIGTA